MKLSVLILLAVIVTTTSCQKFNKEIRQLVDEPLKTLIVYEDGEPINDYKKTVADLKISPYESSELNELSEEKRYSTKETRNEPKKTYEDFKETPEDFNKISEDSNRHGILGGPNIVRPPNIHVGPKRKVLVKKRGGLLHTNFDIISNKTNITNTRLIRSILPENKTARYSKKKFHKKLKHTTAIHDTKEEDNSSVKRNKNKSKRRTRSTTLQKRKQKNKAKKRKSKRRFKSTTPRDSVEYGIDKTKRNKKPNKIIKRKKSKSTLIDIKEHTSKQSKEHTKFKRGIKSTKLEDSGRNISTTKDIQRTTGTPVLENVSIRSRSYQNFQAYNEKPFLDNHQPNRVHYLPIRQNIFVRYPQKRINPIVATHYVPSVSMFIKQYSNKNVIPNNGKMQDCCDKNHQKCQACHKGLLDVYIPIHLKFKDNPQNVDVSSGENSQKRNELEFLKRKKRETIITVIDTMPPINRPPPKRVPFKKSPGKRHQIFNMNYLDHKDNKILYRPKKKSVTPSYDIRVPKFAPSRDKFKDYEDWLELDTIYRKIAKQNRKKPEETNKGTRYYDSHSFKDYFANTNFKKKEYPKTHDRPVPDQTNKRFRYEDKYGESKYFPDENNKINHNTQHVSYEDKRTQKKKYSKNNFGNSYDTRKYHPDMVIKEKYLPNLQYEMSYEENRRPGEHNPKIVHEGFGTKTFPNKEKYLSDSQYEMAYKTKQIKKPYPKIFHKDRYSTKTYPEDINNENNFPDREHEMTYEERPIPKKSYLKKFHQDTSGTKSFPLVNLQNTEYERPYEDKQSLENPYYTNNNEYDTKTYFSDINKKHHPKGFNKLRYEETEPEIIFENQQRPENNQPSMIDSQDYQSSRLKIRHKDIYHPNSNNPVLDHIHKNRPLKKHQEISGEKIHQLKKSPQENIESHYDDMQHQDSLAAESEHSQTNQGYQTIVTKTSQKQHGFAEPPEDYVHPEPSQPFKSEKFLYDEKTNSESKTNDQPLGIYTRIQPSNEEFYDEVDKTSELSHKTRYFTTVTPKMPQGFIEPVKDFSYVEFPRSVDNPVNKPYNDPILKPSSQSGNTFVYEGEGTDLETNVNHGINDGSLNTDSKGQSFDVEAFYDQHEIILPKKRYHYQKTVSDQKHEKSSSPPKDDNYAGLFDEESTDSKFKPNADIINSPLLPQSVNHFLTDEALEDEFDHMFIKVKSNTTTPHRTTISSTTNRFREVSNDETYRERSTPVFDKPLHEKNESKDHESKFKDKRPRIIFHNPMRHLSTIEVSYDQYDPDYIMMTSNIESDPEDDSKLLSSGNGNQNRSHSKNSHSKVIVGGQYAEPPARYIPKLRVRSISQDSSTTTPYINYKNSNMAFSPQNLNDAFSVMR